MKIAIFLPHMGMGGVERSTSILAQELKRRGHDVTVLGLGENSTPGPHFDGLEYIHLPSARVITAVPRLAAYLRNAAPDAAISAQSYANVALMMACQLARYRGKTVLTERLNISASTASTRSLKTRLTLRLMRMAYRRAHAVVAISIGVAQDLSHITGLPFERIAVIHNPVNHPDIHEKAKQPAGPVNVEWLDDPSTRTIVSVARLEPQKNVPLLIRAFAQIEDDNLRLLIIGDGSEREQLEHMATDLGLGTRVTFTGSVENPYAYMSRSDVFVMSSNYEGLGNVLVEALALGLPVVSTDCPSGPAEILDNGRFGILVPVDNAQALAGGIRSALGDYERALSRTRDAQNSLDRFTPETATTRYLELIERPA